MIPLCLHHVKASPVTLYNVTIMQVCFQNLTVYIVYCQCAGIGITFKKCIVTHVKCYGVYTIRPPYLMIIVEYAFSYAWQHLETSAPVGELHNGNDVIPSPPLIQTVTLFGGRTV